LEDKQDVSSKEERARRHTKPRAYVVVVANQVSPGSGSGAIVARG
jgi:hypothetical protein